MVPCGIADSGEYPTLAGYRVLVRDLAEEHVGEDAITSNDVALYLEKTVAGCIDAEFAAYAALPEICPKNCTAGL